jgi:hypothetical protein
MIAEKTAAATYKRVKNNRSGGSGALSPIRVTTK